MRITHDREIFTAQYLAKNHESLLRRTLAWQEVVFTESKLPVWLRDSLVNILYCLIPQLNTSRVYILHPEAYIVSWYIYKWNIIR